MFQQVDVAAISFLPKKFDLKGNADRLESTFRDAAKGGAQLALAPEGVLEGYVVNEIIAGKAHPEDMHEVAVTTTGPVMRRFRNLAKELGISLAFGCAEKIGRDVFNCAVYIDANGRLCGKYHKMQLAEGSHRSWWYNRLGKQSRAFSTPYGRCGFLICNDRWNADIARIPVLDGARFLLIPSFGSRSKSQDLAVLARARENGVPIVEANVGVTMVVAKGEIVARSRKVTEILYATIDVPAAPSTGNRDSHERGFLSWRKKEMPLRYTSTMKKISERDA
jgi:predicted amidohydrolase